MSFIFIVGIMAYLSFWNYQNRVYDWDMPGYIGCLYTLKFPDAPDKVHQLTYSDIKKKASAYEFRDITGTLKIPDKARQAFAFNTKAFTEQLPYFKIKTGYNLAVLLLYESELSSPDAVSLLSIFSYFISGLLAFFILKIIFPENYFPAILLTVGIMLLPPVTYMSRVSTPDLFVLQFLLVFMIGFLKKWSRWMMFSVLFVITFTRPDYLPLTLSYLMLKGIYGYFGDRKLDFSLAAQGIILVILYLTIIKFSGYPGWKHLFYDSFIYRRPLISGSPPHFTLHDYLNIICTKVIHFKKVTLISFGLTGLIFYWSEDRWIRAFSVVVLINIYIKFLIFPHSAGLRFFFGYIILLLFICLSVFSRKYNGFRLRKIV
ncbi:hypothetical protein CHA01nite_15330 [Chryseobacterium hagamense]|uniref:Glycosyltransferase RgtA/B/C/D-like domain-containing protein n=2 Tax=Chryseobacterium hagamense TaxID=395935 RepID=A0A511YKT1_9FLAO|nr:hypothetical protein CHA01nite_15330 [Chryseobacterium hagamense]